MWVVTHICAHWATHVIGYNVTLRNKICEWSIKYWQRNCPGPQQPTNYRCHSGRTLSRHTEMRLTPNASTSTTSTTYYLIMFSQITNECSIVSHTLRCYWTNENMLESNYERSYIRGLFSQYRRAIFICIACRLANHIKCHYDNADVVATKWLWRVCQWMFICLWAVLTHER